MKTTIEYADFEKLDIRVGQVTSAIEPEWSRKLIEMQVDFGPEIGTRTILSGIRKWYVPADLVGKKFPFIINLAERKMGQGVSQGMMMMTDTIIDGEEHPQTIAVSEITAPGTVIR